MRIITPYWPNRRMSTQLFDEMDRMLETFAAVPTAENTERTLSPAWETSEADNHFLLSMELPGFKKEHINIELHGQTLTISGERKREDKVTGRFTRSFTLPNTVEAGKIEAHHEDGILSLYLPKTPVAKAQKIEIHTQKGGFFEKLLGSRTVSNPETAPEPSH